MNTISKALAGTVAAGAMALASATPAAAQDRYRDRDNGISAGEIIAGALVIGGIAAVASAIGKDRGYNGTYGEPYYNGGYYNNRYDNRYYNGGSSRQAVEQCVRAAQQNAYRYGNARVTDIRNVDRKRDGYRVKGTIVVNERNGGWGRDYNYRYGGRDYDTGRFTCDVRYGRVVDLDYSGLR
ncbi:hypothetical protein GRI40_03060 [Altererythrobacter aerius]|uniref:Uncharacterized protein n=1 Tax=Tsuneonella aeria TaxID=1837929 RepID=A0A6I4TA55_9SPHN|nr:hypothetical protein [Tsuneonella aeria]MXO74201.1 hypothetical protein [Tsuneonella aeria]